MYLPLLIESRRSLYFAHKWKTLFPASRIELRWSWFCAWASRILHDLENARSTEWHQFAMLQRGGIAHYVSHYSAQYRNYRPWVHLARASSLRVRKKNRTLPKRPSPWMCLDSRFWFPGRWFYWRLLMRPTLCLVTSSFFSRVPSFYI